ncbi:glycosyltransferase family 4 protein [Stappia sp.]|uniref:glycosyltransferase family 4 protein n=1 Tax=Stappia sp. TaxID=1870903 RepID=UPI0032D9908D
MTRDARKSGGLRIVQICPYDMARPGGVQTHVRDLAAWLAGEGHAVRIVAPEPVEGVRQPGIDHCGRARRVKLFGTGFEISFAGRAHRRRLVAELRDWGADLVHLHTPWTPLMAWQVWRDLALPTVTTFHATLPDASARGLAARALRLAARHFLLRSRAVIVPSPTPLAHLRPEAVGVAAQVLPPSIDLAPWRAAGEAPSQPAGERLGEGEISLVFLGRFEARKGLDVLLDAWPEIAARASGVRLTVAGGGPMEPLLRSALQGPAGDRLTFVPTPDAATARRLVADADLLAAPSRYGESFGLVLIEAMAAGTLPVAAANAGYRTVLTGPGADLLVPPGDAGALAGRIVALARDAAARAALTDWAAAHATTFGIAATGPRFVEVYRRALAPDQVPPDRALKGQPGSVASARSKREG